MADTRQQAMDYARAHHGRFLDGFLDFLRIPSVSTDPAYRADLERCAAWVAAEVERLGFRNVRAFPTAGSPVVYGEWLEAGPDRPTVLVYAHYDVQPVDPLDEWVTPPFEPSIRDGRLYARGAVDDKCGVWINLKAFEAMLAAEGRLPVNVKVFFEGEEEIGSPSMEPFIREHHDLLHADFMLVSDGGSRPDDPTIMYAARGIIEAEVTVSGPARDLHSGLYGGVVHNPLHMVGRIIGALHDDSGRVTVPGFYDNVRPLPPEELSALASYEPEFVATAREDTGLESFWAEPLGSFSVRATALPTLDVNGIWGGYQGPGSKTVIPARGGFKVTMRLVADQDPADVQQKFVDYVKSFATPTASIDVQTGPLGWPVTMMFDGPQVEAIQRAYEATWGKRARLIRAGGSVPIMGMFQRELGMALTSLGYGTGEGVHAPNEYLLLDYFARGIDTAIHFFHNLVE